jgi:broad-specificity NMP kinase
VINWARARDKKQRSTKPMQPKIFFVTGVVGAGKTSLIGLLRTQLGPDYEIHDFDERGVPDDVDEQWGAAERRYWLTTGMANLRRGLATVVCGFTLPSDDDDRDLVSFILLDLNEAALRERLMKRYRSPENVKNLRRMRRMTPEESLQENVGSIPWLRDICSAHGSKIIETSALIPEQTAEQVCDWIRRESKA